MKKWNSKKWVSVAFASIILFTLFALSEQQMAQNEFSYYESPQSGTKAEWARYDTDIIPKEAEPYQQQITVNEQNLELYAKAAALVDADSLHVLYEKDSETTYPMASTTKIMTCVYTLENSNLNDVVTISANAASQPKVHYGLQEGEKYVLKDLLYALMLESYNDCAVAIAEHVGGSVEQFCKDMTVKAKSIGCYNTSFQTPNGLDAEEHYSTALDMARIGAYAIKNDVFLDITNTSSYTVTEINSGRTKTVNNKNAFLTQYDGAIGIKTGYTSKASYCFVGAVKKEDKTLVSCVLASGWYPKKNYKWEDTKKLMDYGSAFKKVTIAMPSNRYCQIKVEKGRKKSVGVYSKEQLDTLLHAEDKLEYKINWSKDKLTAPVKKDTVVGAVKILINGKEYQEIPLFTMEESESFDYEWCIHKTLERFWQYLFQREAS